LARSPKWDAFLARTMPEAGLRRTLAAYSGMGLLGALAQNVTFHYGSGANGKSVFLAVLLGVLGPSQSVGLPK
jgi:putative DNA primase/helicase